MYTASLSGIRAADLILSAAADDVANLNTEDYSRGPVDLVDAQVSQITASAMHRANVHALRVQARTDRSLFDILA